MERLDCDNSEKTPWPRNTSVCPIVFLYEEPIFLEVTDDVFPVAAGSLAVVLLLSFSAAASAQQLNWFWWKMEPDARSSRTDQSTQIEGIFQEGIAQLQKQKDELDRLEGKLSRLIETMATKPEVTQQIDRVEAARSTLNKTRTLMLLHMRQVLKPEQRLKLNALRDRREQEQRRARQATSSRSRPSGTRVQTAPEPSKLVDRFFRLEESEMKSNGLKGLVTCACAFVLATASTATAQKATDQKSPMQRIAELIREAALRAGVEPATATRPSDPGRARSGRPSDRAAVARRRDQAGARSQPRHLGAAPEPADVRLLAGQPAGDLQDRR